MRGKIVGGNWDLGDYNFEDLDVFQAFKMRLRDVVEWKDTAFYSRVLKQAESGRFVWNIKNKHDLDQRCQALDDLYSSIKNEGYQLNYDKFTKAINYDEIDVNIGRNGEYLFQNGVHRLSIAKILGIEKIPVTVLVRHKNWIDFRTNLLEYSKQQNSKKLYQPPIHPDLDDIPFNQETHDWLHLMEAVEKNLITKKGVMLDIGANLAFFCHKFEDIGFSCIAVETDPITCQMAEKIRIAENKKFKIINKSILDLENLKSKQFDVVLALNIFHHFLKKQDTFYQFKNFLKNLKTTELFFEPHTHNERQMKNAYINYNEQEFVNFILANSCLNKVKLIFSEPSGRHVYHLSK